MSAASPPVDPTQTKTRRRRWVQAFNGRWESVRGELREAIDREDRFGISEGRPTADILAEFRDWLSSLLRETVVDPVSTRAVRNGRHWTASSVRGVYEHALKRADTALRTNSHTPPETAPAAVLGAITGTGARGSQRFPAHADLLRTTYERVVRDLRDDVREAEQAILRAVDDAVSEGASRRDVANAATDRVSAVGQTETAKLVHGSVVILVSLAALQRYRNAGVEEVGVVPEARPDGGEEVSNLQWGTAGDADVCPECEDLSEKKWPIKAFSTGDAPVPVRDTHVRCRCFLIPA